jgi:inner membrane protein
LFIPIGGLIVSLVLWPVFRKRLSFGLLYLFATLGYSSHALLDACTSYGTYLLWPLSETRFAWNFVSVIDPLFSVPLLLLLVVHVWRRRPWALVLAWCWAVAYLGLASVQNSRAEAALAAWAADSGLVVERLVAKPAFANIILWRCLVDDGERFHLVAIRTLPFSSPQFWSGGAVERFRSPGLLPDSRLARDLERFRHFSSDWLFRYRPYEEDDMHFVGDFRYAIDPASQRPLWGVVFDPNRPESRARYTTPRTVNDQNRSAFFDRLRGRDPSNHDNNRN